MIRHIVMFKLMRSGNEESLEETKMEVKNRLEALLSLISVIRSMEVGINVVKSERAFDVALVSTFDSLEDLETYRVHPDHQKVVSYIATVKDQSAAVDFEF
ncbi:hypothetical protein LCGC14_2595700 [marine sediment metagenome]|uniref:Stress-response A/B barrel domain-containing protein n=1 Tax=marine sediment metagenome TaxID=412755 RepID=A0A0F9CLA0_9ZZZZ|nr:Dabb family protein [Bacteroides sp.]